jgi:hypothetical protein
VSNLKNRISEIECIVCNGVYFRKGFSVAVYEKFDEALKWNEKAEAQLNFYLDSEEEHPLNRTPESTAFYSYICEDCGFIMNFTKEKNVESKKQDRQRKQKQIMYDWTKFK